MSIASRIVLGTLAFFNALIFVVLGATAMWFVNGAAGPILGGCFWLFAGMLFGLARWLRRGTEWRSRP